MSVVLATAGYDHKIRFWEAPSGICSRIIKFSDSQVNRLEITPDKQFIAAAGNPTIRLYEITSASNTGGRNNNSSYDQSGGHHQHHQQIPPVQQPVLTLEGHTGNVTSMGFQKDGKFLYTGSDDGTVKIWDLRNPSYSRSFYCGSAVNSVTLRRDRDEIISGDQNGFVKVWDLKSGSNSNSSSTNNSTRGGNNATTEKNNNGCISSFQPAKVMATMFQNKSYIGNNNNPRNNNNNNGNGIAGTAGTSTIDNTGLSDRVNNSGQHQNYHTSTNNVFTGSNGGVATTTAISGSGSNVKKQRQQFTEGIVPIQAVDISEDSRTLVTITNHGTVFVWDPSNSGAVTAAQELEHMFGGGGANSNSTGTATSGSNSTSIAAPVDATTWNVNYLRPVTKFRVVNPGSYCLHGKIAPDCRHLVTTSSDGNAKLWDTITWELTQTLVHRPIPHHTTTTTTTGGNNNNDINIAAGTNTPKRWVWDAAFCADSGYLVTACSDHVARLWNLGSGNVVRQYHGHQSAVTCVALNDRSI